MKRKLYKSIGIRDKNKDMYLHTYTCKICGNIITRWHGSKNILHSFICNKHNGDLNYNKDKCKSVKFIQITTGQIDQSISITSFCDKHKELGKYAKHHFTEILNGKRLHYKGWMLEDTYNRIDKNKVIESCQLIIKPAIIYEN